MKRKKARHRGRYDGDALRLRQAANATPGTHCWRDGLTLTQHRPHRDGTPPKWTAGHTDRATPEQQHRLRTDPHIIHGPGIASEASTCNYSDGATYGNTTRVNPRSRNWLD